MTVRQLLASLDSAELSEWLAFMHVQSSGEKPQDDDAAWRKAFNAYG
jgi:hypothetical protein